MTQDFAKGDVVRITSVNVEGNDRDSVVEGAVDQNTLIVRPKHFRQLVEVDVECVQMVKAIRRNRAKNTVVFAKESNVRPTEELVVGTYGRVPDEIVDQVRKLVDRTDELVGTNFGNTPLFWGLIYEINRHIDDKKIQRG